MQYELILVIWAFFILWGCGAIFILMRRRQHSSASIRQEPVKVIKKPPKIMEEHGKFIVISAFWIFFLDIALAELLTIFVEVWAGIVFYSLIFVFLIIFPVFTASKDNRNLIWGLSIVPLIRIVSISIPLAALPQIYWYPILYLPLLAASCVIMRAVELKPGQVGLIKRFFPWQIILGVITGIGFGLIEYFILKPEPLVASFTIGNIVIASIILIVTTGFVEELIFRGILQKLVEPVMQIWGIVYISCIFAILHIGFLSMLDVLYVFIVSLCFAYAVKKTGSLVGVILSHGTANIILFVIAPLVLG